VGRWVGEVNVRTSGANGDMRRREESGQRVRDNKAREVVTLAIRAKRKRNPRSDSPLRRNVSTRDGFSGTVRFA
jgi:hypothetical protein